MSGIPSTDIALLHGKIKESIEAKFPDFEEVTFYDRINGKLNTPAFLFELEDVEPAPDSGGDQFDCILNFVGYVVVAFNHPLAKLACRVKALNTALHIRNQRFESPVGCAIIKGVDPDDFNTALGGILEHDAYEVLRVSWTHEAAIGESVWNGEPDSINQIWLGIAPEIGLPNVEDYILLNKQTETFFFAFEDEDGFVFMDEGEYVLASTELDFSVFTTQYVFEDEDGFILMDEDEYLLSSREVESDSLSSSSEYVLEDEDGFVFMDEDEFLLTAEGGDGSLLDGFALMDEDEYVFESSEGSVLYGL